MIVILFESMNSKIVRVICKYRYLKMYNVLPLKLLNYKLLYPLYEMKIDPYISTIKLLTLLISILLHL